jgi:hypothetical protein
MKLSKEEKKFKALAAGLPANLRYDFTPIIQRVDETTISCQMKVEILNSDTDGRTNTERKVAVVALGNGFVDAQYNALRLALVQLNLL